MKKKSTILILFLIISNFIKAQEPPKVQNPPVIMEGLVGSRGFSYQLVADKKFQSVPKLGYYTVVNFQTDWGESKIGDYMLQGHLTYSVLKGLNAEAGFFANPVDGIRPSAGLIYTYVNPKVFLLANPRIDMTKNPNAEVFALAEYKPKVNEKLNLYTKIQGLYCHNLGSDFHSRSYIWVRAGLTVKEFTFGLAANVDFYGSAKYNENNLGVFLMVNML
ncbi:hypothetical protein [Epilithonimonas mollis]|uniref:Uncharacterized protein n=1 Tax=Epilithonimonas mollis TaxID=216903 RepID=A0A1M6SFY1_9FLAO|nr:hypothetical protein [Epilithonimonas mollis]SHK43575.1 hypothetical protein SAMN05444371_2440 [Epilithonimonas mollis]